jgi:hypothetical protein
MRLAGSTNDFGSPAGSGFGLTPEALPRYLLDIRNKPVMILVGWSIVIHPTNHKVVVPCDTDTSIAVLISFILVKNAEQFHSALDSISE